MFLLIALQTKQFSFEAKYKKISGTLQSTDTESEAIVHYTASFTAILL
jgi:hypothetical protein